MSSIGGHTKTPGGQAASDKFNKQQSATHGTGTAPEAPAGESNPAPGEAPVASDSGRSNVGIDNGASNVPGEKGIGGPLTAEEGQNVNMGNMK